MRLGFGFVLLRPRPRDVRGEHAILLFAADHLDVFSSESEKLRVKLP
jgi:hypothetical protein